MRHNQQALRLAQAKSGPHDLICVTGSLFAVGEARERYRSQPLHKRPDRLVETIIPRGLKKTSNKHALTAVKQLCAPTISIFKKKIKREINIQYCEPSEHKQT